ncbi:MAG TPA: hypothetical protein VFE62_29055 [Gemmataceae bacterium]|nr:hypothetical protein [Gemmataceae bacterium]
MNNKTRIHQQVDASTISERLANDLVHHQRAATVRERTVNASTVDMSLQFLWQAANAKSTVGH